jgi:hypothetical protein
MINQAKTMKKNLKLRRHHNPNPTTGVAYVKSKLRKTHTTVKTASFASMDMTIIAYSSANVSAAATLTCFGVQWPGC